MGKPTTGYGCVLADVGVRVARAVLECRRVYSLPDDERGQKATDVVFANVELDEALEEFATLDREEDYEEHELEPPEGWIDGEALRREIAEMLAKRAKPEYDGDYNDGVMDMCRTVLGILDREMDL